MNSFSFVTDRNAVINQQQGDYHQADGKDTHSNGKYHQEGARLVAPEVAPDFAPAWANHRPAPAYTALVAGGHAPAEHT